MGKNKHIFGPRKAQNLGECRAKASTRDNVLHHYTNYKKMVESVGTIPSSCYWNLDETGMCAQGSRNKKKVLTTKGKRANVQQSNDRTNISALVCVNAGGGFIPPFSIMPGVNIRRSDTHGGFPGAKYAASESSFLTTKLFVQYFEWFATLIPPERPVVVVMDGYKCHFSYRTLEHARSLGIKLYKFPAHTSHFLQPLDVSVFQHFKQKLDHEISSFRISERRSVVKGDFVAVASRALSLVLTRSNIVAGFEKTGLFPLSKEHTLNGIVGNQPHSKTMRMVLQPTVVISNRTQNRLKRAGLDPDTTRVLAFNHWELEKHKERKKRKVTLEDELLHGGCIMTTDEMTALVQKKNDDRIAQVEEKKRKQVLRAENAALREMAKAKAAEERAERDQNRNEAARQWELKREEGLRQREAKREEKRLLQAKKMEERARTKVTKEPLTALV